MKIQASYLAKYEQVSTLGVNINNYEKQKKKSTLTEKGGQEK